MRCLFLKHILENETSQVYKFFELQKNNPIKGDWVSTSLKDLSELKISESIEEIKKMTKNRFKSLIKSRILINALEYLNKKRGSKGKELEYSTIEMAEYLMPFNMKLNIEDKRKLFEMRNRMTRIENNFGNKEEKCICGAIETMAHIYYCKSLNQNEPETPYDRIYNGNLKSQIEILKRFEKNLEVSKENKYPRDLRDPLNCT